MNIVITMAGAGTRFTAAGFDVPKPLVAIRGVPMYALVASCLPMSYEDQLIFVCLAEHLDRFNLAEDIQARFGHLRPVVVEVESVTRGQACTAWAALPHLKLGDGLLIHNADTIFEGNLDDTLATFPRADGVMGVFRAQGDHWSFAEVDQNGLVVRTAEKRRISDWASTGMYYFRSTEQYGRLLDAELSQLPIGAEAYIAPLYNALLAEGGEVRIDPAINVWPLGTPEELAFYLGRKQAR